MNRLILLALLLPSLLHAQTTEKLRSYRNLLLVKTYKLKTTTTVKDFDHRWTLGYVTPFGLHSGFAAETPWVWKQKTTLRNGRDYLFRPSEREIFKTRSIYGGALLYRQAGFHTGFLPYARLDFGRTPGTKSVREQAFEPKRFSLSSGPWLGALTTFIPGPTFEPLPSGGFSEKTLASRTYICPGYHLRLNVRVSPAGEPLHLLQFRADAALPLNWGAGFNFLPYFGLAYTL